MPTFRASLPQLAEDLFLTDGGIETTLIFLEGFELRHFAAFHLLRDKSGEDALRKYFGAYMTIAQRHGAGLILESPTWRASADWSARLGYSARDLAKANARAIRLLEDVRDEGKAWGRKIVISGCVGPRGDGYNPTLTMSEREAEAYHADQIQVFEDSAADMVAALTMNYAEEAVGITRAAERHGMPVAISFTVETDGKLPTGQSLRAAIEQVDTATSHYPAYFMINCAHPTHFAQELATDEPWTGRIRGVRANASGMSHAELNDSPKLDPGDPVEFGQQHADLKRRQPQLTVMGGCCGTDVRHIERIAAACAPLFGAAGR